MDNGKNVDNGVVNDEESKILTAPSPVRRKFGGVKFVGVVGQGKYDRFRQLVIPIAIFDAYRDEGHLLMDGMGLPMVITIELWGGQDLHDE